MFSIKFVDEPLEYPFDDTSIPAAPGTLTLGKTTEEFLANLSLWGKADYESHWMRELKALYEGRPKIALVVSYDDPKAASNMEIWRVYRDGEWVYFQNQLLFYSKQLFFDTSLPKGFEISKISGYIDERDEMDSEGNRISEWRVALRDIELFLQHSNAL